MLLRLLLASECTQLSCYYCHHLTPASSVLPHRWKIISPQYSFRFSVGTSKASSRLVNCAPIYFSDSSADSYYGTTQTDLCQDSESSFVTYTLYSFVKSTMLIQTVVPGMSPKQQQKSLKQVQAAMLLGLYDPANLMILKVSVVGKDGVWSLWQGPRSESQWRPLGFWGKALLSPINKDFFERQL